MQKVNVLLALRQKTGARFTKMVAEYTAYFKSKQGAFKGVLKTHSPLDGYSIDPTKVANERVVTTVNEQMDWFIKGALDYLNITLSIEASNSEGAPSVALEFDGKTYGPYTAAVLLRLRGVLEGDNVLNMFNQIPVREETKVWMPATDDEDYKRRGIVQTERQSGETRTTETHDEILKDVNLDPQHLPSNYSAKVTQIRKTVKTGDYTAQFFSGEWTHEKRANLLKRRSMLLDAIDIALQNVNDREAVECKVDDLLQHLIYG